MPPHQVGFLHRFHLKTGTHFGYFGLESCVFFDRTTDCINVFIVSIPNQWERNRNMRIGHGLESFFYLRSSLSNHNIISPYRPGLKKAINFTGLLWKRVWKITFFDSEIGSRFQEPGRTSPTTIPRSTPRVLTFNNDAKQLPKWILHEYHLSQNGLPRFETFTWQNLTLADMVIPFATPTYQP